MAMHVKGWIGAVATTLTSTILMSAVVGAAPAATETYFDFPVGSRYVAATGWADSTAVRTAFGWKANQLRKRADEITFTFIEHTTYHGHCIDADGIEFVVDGDIDLAAPIASTPARVHRLVTGFTLHGVATDPPVVSTIVQVDDLDNQGCPEDSTPTTIDGDTFGLITATFEGVTVTVH